MPRIFFILAVSLWIASVSKEASASGWDETFFVMQMNSGALVKLEYSSENEDEQKQIRKYEPAANSKPKQRIQCIYSHLAKPKKMLCSIHDRSKTSQTFEERPTSSGQPAHKAQEIYLKFVGKRLESSVGGLGDVIYICTKGCQNHGIAAMIMITCAECGMDEAYCDLRQKDRSKVATISTDLVNLREMPNLSSRVIKKLAANQEIIIIKAAPRCTEVKYGIGAVDVGRWIRVKVGSAPGAVEGWLFDPHVKYNYVR
jgi:hypothetical protein